MLPCRSTVGHMMAVPCLLVCKLCYGMHKNGLSSNLLYLSSVYTWSSLLVYSLICLVELMKGEAACVQPFSSWMVANSMCTLAVSTAGSMAGTVWPSLWFDPGTSRPHATAAAGAVGRGGHWQLVLDHTLGQSVRVIASQLRRAGYTVRAAILGTTTSNGST